MLRGGDKSLTKSLTYHSPNSGHKKLWLVFSSRHHRFLSILYIPVRLLSYYYLKMKALLPLEITKSAQDARGIRNLPPPGQPIMSSLDLQATLSTEKDEKCVAGKNACVLLFI